MRAGPVYLSNPEALMCYDLFLMVGFALVWPQDTAEARRALAIVRQSKGAIAFDEKTPGRPVIGINL
jgi:hypothetical protein